MTGKKPLRRCVLALVFGAIAMLAAACGSESANTTPVASGATSTPAPAQSTPEPVPESTVDQGQLSLLPVEFSEPGVGWFTQVFVDESRATPPSRDDPGKDSRTLPTLIAYPSDADPDPADGMEGAAPAPSDQPYPMVMFAHGLSSAAPDNTALIEQIAAAGYIVAAPTFPRTSRDNPGGADAGDTPSQPGDISFLIDTVSELNGGAEWPLAGLVDIETIAMTGHSNGAVTTYALTANSCCVDERIDASVIIAGTPTPFEGEYDFTSTPPVLLIHGTADRLIPSEASVGTFNQLTSIKGLLALIDGDHSSYLSPDDPFFPDVVTTLLDFVDYAFTGNAEADGRLAEPRSAEGAELTFAAEADSGLMIEVEEIERDRRASVEPAMGLVDGQVVTVSWSGFIPGRVVNIVQCSLGALTGNDVCDLTTAKILQDNPTGEGSLELEIIVGPVGTGICDATVTDCVIAVNDSSLPDESATIRVPIAFAE